MALEDTIDLPLTGSQHQGRILRVDFTWQQQPLTVVAVYAPRTAPDRQYFFRDLLLPVTPHHDLVDEDFNCVGSDLDIYPTQSGDAGLATSRACSWWETPLDSWMLGGNSILG